MRAWMCFGLLVGFGGTMGCGGTSAPTVAQQEGSAEVTASQTAPAVTPTPAATAEPQFQAQRPAKSYENPAEAVSDFLVAVKSGDDQMATALLTTAAQQEAWTNGLAISSDGFADANFNVSEVELLKDKQEAHVMSVWSDVSPEGDRKSFQCVWLLRAEEHGWCIYGMATKFLETAPPVILNFENQSEMQRRQKWAEQQIVNHRQQQTPTAASEPARQPIQQATRPSQSVIK